jgi:hypothetical protein
VSLEPGRLEELSVEQRERALCYLLEKLHVFQSSKQHRVLGLSHQLDPAVSLPPLARSPGRCAAASPPKPQHKRGRHPVRLRWWWCGACHQHGRRCILTAMKELRIVP